jgi:hypothetical protein
VLPKALLRMRERGQSGNPVQCFAAVWLCSGGKAEQGFAGAALQPTLVPRFGFRERLTPGVGVCRDKPARCEGVQVSDSEGLANHTGPESCASVGTGVREALTGAGAGRVLSPESGLFLGADALRTRGRPQRGPRYGKASPPPAGAKTPGMHGNLGCGTREVLPLAWAIAPRSARRTSQGARP